jgi:hypothetical protein
MRIPIALAAALLASAACGSSPSAPPVAGSSGHLTALSSPASTTAQREHAWLAWTACVRRHGGDIPDPAFNQEGSPQWQTNVAKNQPAAALDACKSLLQATDAGRTSHAPTAAELAQESRFAQCIRQHGVPAFPDPDPQTGRFPPTFDKTSPALQPAEQACAQDAPKGKGG